MKINFSRQVLIEGEWQEVSAPLSATISQIMPGSVSASQLSLNFALLRARQMASSNVWSLKSQDEG